MKTQELIGLLAGDTYSVQPPAWQQVTRASLLAGLVCTTMLITLWGINPQMRQMSAHPAFIIKMLWLAGLISCSTYGVLRLARPGLSAGHTTRGLLLCLLTMLGLGLAQSLHAPAGARQTLWMGTSWQVCSASIAALALPVLAALLWTLRQLAPTRPALAGAVAGVMAGSLAASIYSLHCTETSFAFFALWYVAGIAGVSVLGALCGQRFLRW